MRFVIGVLVLLISVESWSQGTNDLPFQVLAASGASIYGEEVKPLQFIDDVTSVDIVTGGFLSLVHQSGSTFEKNEKVFTFYLKPDPFKTLPERPDLGILFQDSVNLNPPKRITVLDPIFDRSGYLVWNKNDLFNVKWYLHDQPVLTYVLTISDSDGNKIQDFRTKKNTYVLKPETFGLDNGVFSFKIKSTFAGETHESKTYTVQLQNGPKTEVIASDLILKALNLELNPQLALPIWQQALAMKNGGFFRSLFKNFLVRNREALILSGEDVELLLSQNK